VLALLRPSLPAVICLAALGCVDTRKPGTLKTTSPDGIDRTVTIDAATPLAVVPPLGYGMHSSVYDNSLHDPATPGALDQAGIRLLRYPGGGYSDNYHWSTHTLSPFHSGGKPSPGYIADASDFGSYDSLLESFGGSVMVTVNYGTNFDGTGPGEPKEAAAWVAYANGEPADDRELGLDGSGNDWHSVGYWAALRAASALASDDGVNFLRIAHPAPLGVKYWEIGNELFGNGYYGQNFEEDLHAAYDTTGPYNNDGRRGLPSLSGGTYGAGVVAYAEAMRAVDPSIAIGAVLGTKFDGFGPSWNAAVLGACAPVIDFGIVHFYPGQDASSLLAAPRLQIAESFADLRQQFTALAGDHGQEIELAVTEVGPGPSVVWPRMGPARHAMGLFAADAYLSFLAEGAVNVDWLELHNGTFLSESSSAKGPAYYGISLAHLLAAEGDTLVATTTMQGSIVTHAALRADGSLGILVVNTQAPASDGSIEPVDVPVTSAGDDFPTSGLRYDYAPAADQPGVLGEPTAVSDVTTPFTVTLAPYQATLFVLGTP